MGFSDNVDTRIVDLVIASKNKGKVAEITALVGDLPVRILLLNDFPSIPDVKETGTTFAENAEIKARSMHAATGLTALADDSGLEVDALDGRPGIYSSRFAGENATDKDRCALLLKAMDDVPDEHRTARFRTVACIVGPDGKVHFTEGTCEGVITRQPAGDNGFGYDPVFYLPRLGKTMAQLTSDEKNAISHRGKALRAVVEILKALACSGMLSSAEGILK